uniref:TACO1/YebC-like second and third domain-containing protein n=1 Tax=Glossina palpalis gambiensis TaxID=67801 RepID=A0A1B0BV23_9MUSC
MTDEFNEKCKIAQNDTLGRYVRACENIKAGEPILNETPILIIACPGDKRCNNESLINLSKCSITPLFSNCRSHHLYDCNTFSLMSKEVQFENLRKNPECYFEKIYRCQASKVCQQNKTELKRYRLDLRFKQKVFIVLIIYTDNYSGLKQEIAPILRKSGAMIDTNNLFEEYGLIEATVSKERLVSSKNIEELATEDAIECGAEEVEVSDAAAGLVNKYVELPSEEHADYEKFLAKLHQISGIEEIYDNSLDTRDICFNIA